MELTGWGRCVTVESEVFQPRSPQDLLDHIRGERRDTLIARGLGRSYGDSALAAHSIGTTGLNHLLRFDDATGRLTCQAGVSLADILSVFVPGGWFLPVTPGTKFVTVGGAIASDVHGKNHHIDGSFSDHVDAIKIATAGDGIVECSRELHPELFQATCGGMGLTGIIVEVTLRLKSIKSAYIDETTIKARNLEEALHLFEENEHTTYSVAWIDCLSTGRFMGRSLLMLGEHASEGGLVAGKPARLAVPVDMPHLLLNRYSIQAFNTLYYNRVRKPLTARRIHYEPFFYPLDGIDQWNRMYGKRGFIQYQFVLPKAAGLEGMAAVLQKTAASKRGSFLSVLKAFGKGNQNYLSFPMEGYTLALDFKLDRSLPALLNELDRIVLDHGGRLYLTKDGRMPENVFKLGYPGWETFMEVRTRSGADRRFNSLQSRRLGL